MGIKPSGDRDYLIIEKRKLSRTLYGDFVPDLRKNSIYKSITLVDIKDDIAYYEAEPYDDAYKTNSNQFEETCYKVSRAFKKYYQKIFEKYGVNNIIVSIYDDWSTAAGVNVYPNGEVENWNF